MFTLTSEPEFTHVVTVQTPVDGGHRSDTFKCRFKVPTGTDHMVVTTAEGMQEFLRLSVQHLDDLVDEAGQPLVYNNAVRDQMLALPFVRVALMRAYMDAVIKARAGN